MTAHLTSPHFQQASQKLKELLDGAMGLEMYEVVA
jgi:quinol monooxygenase YgiN